MAAVITAFRKRVWKRCAVRQGSKRESRDYRVPDAEHAFNADYRPSYHAESAKDGWQRMLEWFTQYGVKSNAIVAKSDD